MSKKMRVGFAVDTNGVATEVTETYGAARWFTTTEFIRLWDGLNVAIGPEIDAARTAIHTGYVKASSLVDEGLAKLK
jgi:hypothetical protein